MELLHKIKAAFNSEVVNFLVSQLEKGNKQVIDELLHVMSVACDLKSPINKDIKLLYDNLKEQFKEVDA